MVDPESRTRHQRIMSHNSTTLQDTGEPGGTWTRSGISPVAYEATACNQYGVWFLQILWEQQTTLTGDVWLKKQD